MKKILLTIIAFLMFFTGTNSALAIDKPTEVSFIYINGSNNLAYKNRLKFKVAFLENVKKLHPQIKKRFEEDESRYDNPALTALLNIALQDPVPRNTIMAMSPIATESAHGDELTRTLLEKLAVKENKKMHGKEAQMAQEALLKLSHTKA